MASELSIPYAHLAVLNYYLQYIHGLHKSFNRWCDFKAELGKILHSFDYVLSKITPDANLNSYEVPIRGKLETLFSSSIFASGWRGFSFASYDDYRTGTLIDTEYHGKYDYSSLSNRIEEIRKSIIDGLYEDLSIFKSIFKLYLKTVIVRKNKRIERVNIENVVTFNYSETIENSTLVTNVFHIHGSLSGEIVLGVDSTKPFINERFNRFTKESQRGRLSDSQSLFELINGANIIGYFGLSFDSSDKRSLEYIFKNTDAAHYVFYYKGDLDETITNIQKIIGMDYYSSLKNKGNINFIDSSTIAFVDR